MIGHGPHITEASMLAYLRDELNDPVTQQWLDQHSAAADDVREAFGVVSDGTRKIPTERAWKALSSMWARLVAESEADVCAHIEHRPLQAILIIPEECRQLCIDCADGYVWRPAPESGKHACPGCGDIEKLTTRGDPSGSLWANMLQWGHFVAPLLLCAPCRNVMIHEREGLPIDLEIAIHKSHEKDGDA